MNEEKRKARNAKAIGTALRKAGIHSREALLSTRFDKGSTYQDIYGIGPVYGPHLREMVGALGPDEWRAATGRPWDEGDRWSNYDSAE